MDYNSNNNYESNLNTENNACNKSNENIGNGGSNGNNGANGNNNFPVRTQSGGFANAAMVLGIISIVTAAIMTVYPPFILGSLAILFAILSKGRAPKLAAQAKAGIICAITGLSVNVCIIAFSFFYIFSNPDMLRETAQIYDNMCEQIYGMPSEEVIGDSMENIVDDLIDRMNLE